jgi:hypothetical protein
MEAGNSFIDFHKHSHLGLSALYCIKQLSSNKKQFKKALLQCFHLHLFYDIEEFLITKIKNYKSN